MKKIKNFIRKFIPKSLLNLRSRHIHSKIKTKHESLYLKATRGLEGIEIGGPSLLFRYSIPIYKSVNHLDGVNFSTSTIWEGKIASDESFKYLDGKTGKQFIAEAANLHQIKSQAYDFLVSSNCIEHIANPIKALIEWNRILKRDAHLILIAPKKDNNFDHRRNITDFNHLIEDYEKNIDESDLTHLEEIISLHDLSLDPLAGSLANFRLRSLENYHNRALHHHVFDLDLIAKTVDYAGFEVIAQESTATDLITLAKKINSPTA